MTADLTAQLAEYGSYHSAMQSPVSVTEVAARARPVRPVSAGLEPSALGPRMPHRALLIAVAALLVILLAVGGAALLMRSPVEVEPAEDIPLQVPVPVTVLPGETVVDSSLGQVTWQALRAVPGDLPQTILAANGILIGISDGIDTVWRSEDGISWSQAAPPGSIRSASKLSLDLTEYSDGVILTGATLDSPSAWATVDGLEWSAVDLGWFEPEIQGLEWSIELHAVSSGDLELRQWDVLGSIPWRSLVDRHPVDGFVHIEEVDQESGLIELVLWDRQGENGTAELGFSVRESGGVISIDLLDPSTDAILHTVSAPADHSPAQLLMDVDEWRIRSGVWTLLRDEDEAIVDPPPGIVAPVDEGFLAYAPSSPPGAWEIWSSEDGQTWSLVGPLRLGDQSRTYGTEILANRGTLLMFQRHDDDSASLWQSRDGLQWEHVEDPPPPPPDYGSASLRIHQTEHGWVAHYPEQLAFWTSPDGTEWDKVTTAGGIAMSAAGAALFASSPGPYRSTTWVGTFE